MSGLSHENEFRRVYEDYYELLLRRAYSQTGNSHDAEDICQSLFVAYYEKHETIRQARKWLFGALRILILRYYKRVKYDNRVVFMDNNCIGFNLSGNDEDNDIKMIIEELLDNEEIFSNEMEKEIFSLTGVAGLPLSKTAEQLGLEYRKVKYRYSIIIKKIQNYLKNKGLNELNDLV